MTPVNDNLPGLDGREGVCVRDESGGSNPKSWTLAGYRKREPPHHGPLACSCVWLLHIVSETSGCFLLDLHVLPLPTDLYVRDRAGFDNVAREWTRKFAM